MLDILFGFLKQLTSGMLSPVKKIGWYRNVYRPQVLAKKNPYTTCFSHCTAWFLQNVSSFYDLENMSPDTVTAEINSQKYQDWTLKNLGRNVLNSYVGNLNQLWDVERKYIEDRLLDSGELYGRRVVFDYNVNAETIKKELSNSPVIINTTPIYNGVKLGHIMLIQEYLEEQDSWIISDPFGDFRDGYKRHDNGERLSSPVEKFDKQYRGKMAIYLV